MAAIDLSYERTRAGVRVIPSLMALTAIAWVAYLSVRFARDAYRTADQFDLVDGLDLAPELQIIFGAAAIALVPGIAAWATLPRALPGLRTLAVLAALVAAALLTYTSGQAIDVLVFVGLVCWCRLVGSPLLAWLDPGGDLGDGWARFGLEAGLGLALLSYEVLALALAGILGDAALIAVLLATPLLTSFRIRGVNKFPWLRARQEDADHQAHFIEYVSLVALGVTLLVSFGVSLAPQVHFDALHYHFAMPRILLAEGRFVERPDIIQSYFPLGLEMAYVPAYRFGGETSMTLLHWAFAPMTAAVLWATGNRYFGRPAGAIAASALVLAPLVTWDSAGASSDVAMTFWLVTAGAAVAAYAAKSRPRLALAAGLFTGLALTFKIVSGIYVIPISLLFGALLLANIRRAWRRRVQEALLFVAGGTAAGAPWLLLRLIQTGNPIFPLYNDVFKSEQWPPIREKFDLWLYGIGHSLNDLGSAWWEVAVNPYRFGQWHPAWAIGLPVLVCVAALPFLPQLVRGRGQSSLLALAVLAAGAWFFLSQYHRYGLPAFALMALAGGGGLWAALRETPRPFAGALAAGAIAVWFTAGILTSLVMFRPDPFPADIVFGHESRDAYRLRAVPDYEALSFVDSKTRGTGEDAAVLGFPGNFFVLNRLYDSTLPAELSPFRRIASSTLSPGAMARALLDEGVHWLLIDYRPPPGEQTWPPQWLASSLLAPEFITRHTSVEFDKDGVVVYRILDR